MYLTFQMFYTLINMGMDKYGCFMQMYTILPKVLGRPLLMNRFDYFSNLYEYKS